MNDAMGKIAKKMYQQRGEKWVWKQTSAIGGGGMCVEGGFEDVCRLMHFHRQFIKRLFFFLVYFFSFSWDKLCGGSNLPKKKKLSVVGHCELKWRGTAEKYKKTKIQHAQREGWSEKEWQDNKEKRGMSSRRHREDENKGERVRGEEQSGGGSVGGPIVMNRWWGEEKVKPVSVGVAGTHPVLCGQMCGALSLSPPLSSLLPGRCCQCPLACAQKLTHLFAFVLCYFWKRVKIASPSTENHVHVSQSR